MEDKLSLAKKQETGVDMSTEDNEKVYTIEYCEQMIQESGSLSFNLRSMFDVWKQKRQQIKKNGTTEKKPTLMDTYKAVKKAQMWHIEGKQDSADYYLMCKNLRELKNQLGKDEKKTEFAAFYENALVGAFCRYRHSKTQTWGLLPSWLETLLGGTLAASALVFADIFVPMVGNKIDAGAGPLDGVSPFKISVVGIALLLAYSYVEWRKKKNDKETWVRHSTCFSRLNLLLQRYILSDQTESEYQFFVESTFAILDQNLDQFALNLSTNGLAERGEVKMQEAECDQEMDDQKKKDQEENADEE